MAGECGPTGQPLALAAGVEILAAAAGMGFWQAGPHPSGSGERKCVFLAPLSTCTVRIRSGSSLFSPLSQFHMK